MNRTYDVSFFFSSVCPDELAKIYRLIPDYCGSMFHSNHFYVFGFKSYKEADFFIDCLAHNPFVSHVGRF